jgi:hypothetical protein
MRSIRLFMATCGHESAKGQYRQELLRENGTTGKKYAKTERGAGYIQLTWRDAQMKFLSYVPDAFSGIDTSTHIADNYPWEAAGWFWSSTAACKTAAGSLNDYVVRHGDGKGVFLITQYYVNWGYFPNAVKMKEQGLQNGTTNWQIKREQYKDENGVTKEQNVLFVNGEKISIAPDGWQD